MADTEAPSSAGAPEAPVQQTPNDVTPEASAAPDGARQGEAVTAAEDGPEGPATGAPASVASAGVEASPSKAGGQPAPETGDRPPAVDVQGEAQAEAAGEQATLTGQPAPGQAEGEAGAKRKRRRKRKRKGSAEGGAEGASAEAAAEAGSRPGRAKKKDAHVPFGHLFTGGARRHAFSVGEVVAGRVARVEDGAIVVDLFGKALAIADEFEPREVPPQPVQPVVEAPAEPVAQAVPAQSEQAEASPQDAEGGVEAVPAQARAVQSPAEAQATPGVSESEAPEAQAAASEAEVAPAEPVPAGATPDAPDLAAPGTASSDEVGRVVAAPAAAGDTAGAEEPAVTAVGDVEAGVEPEAGDSSAGEVSAPRSALPPVPVVPEEDERPAPLELGAIFRGRVGAVAESGHIAVINRNVDTAAVRSAMEQYRDGRRRVEGLVFGFNRGGFDVLVAGIRGFCPASAMSLHEIGDPNDYVGRKFQFLLPQAKPVGKDVIVTRRSILEREARKKAKELLKNLKPGMRLKGQVSSVREFGLFVDIGGVEGLVHQSELSYVFGTKPQDVASPGDEVEVQVLRVGGPEGGKRGDARGGDRKERRDRTTRVSLSMKALQADPWDEHAEALAEGGVRTGKVTRTTDFGAFVELAPGIEGLLHITELGRDLKHANQAVSEGDELHVVVERADRKARRISLSRLTDSEMADYLEGKLGGDAAQAPRSLRTGAIIKVTVDRIEQRGVHVRVAGVIGKRARGYLPGSETGLERGSDLRKAFPLGQEIEVKVIGTDRDGGLRCSVKALQIDEERKAIKDYRREASKQGFGTFGDLLKAKLGG